ncbi:MAG: hypothetical protein NXI32_25340 [bacterium]|nr:hypothetical protein [bacterium]
MEHGNSKCIDPWVLALLRCPLTHEELRDVSPTTLEKLISRQSAGDLVNHQGFVCQEAFDNGVINESATFFHPMRHGVLTLMPGEAIPITKLR